MAGLGSLSFIPQEKMLIFFRGLDEAFIAVEAAYTRRATLLDRQIFQRARSCIAIAIVLVLVLGFL